MMPAQAELEKFLNRKTTLFEQALINILNAKYNTLGDVTTAVHDLARLMRDTLILADLFGRRRTLIEFDQLTREAQFSTLPDRNPIVPGVTFDEAVADMVTREPRLVDGAAEAAKLYSEEHVFALARSSSLKLTERVQQAVLAIIREGKSAGMTTQEITRLAAAESHDWTKAYAGTVYETNVSSAITNGRFQQAKDPEIAQVIKAFEVVGVDDNEERANHRLARGLIAAVDDPVWTTRKARPPYGYRCRHGVIATSKFTLERMGLLRPDGTVQRFEPPGFDKFTPDPGFGGGVL